MARFSFSVLYYTVVLCDAPAIRADSSYQSIELPSVSPPRMILHLFVFDLVRLTLWESGLDNLWEQNPPRNLKQNEQLIFSVIYYFHELSMCYKQVSQFSTSVPMMTLCVMCIYLCEAASAARLLSEQNRNLLVSKTIAVSIKVLLYRSYGSHHT